MRNQPYRRKRPEPTITLINVVFLMLIFFLVAGTIAPPLSQEVALVRVADSDPLVPPDVLAITAAGVTYWRGRPADPATFLAGLAPGANGVARVMPDRNLAAPTLIAVARALRASGAKEVRLVTQRGAP